MRFAIVLCIICLLALISTMAAQEKKIEAAQVKYDGLKQEVLKHRGKVVLVDFWATWCVPCKEGFPKVIKLNKKHGSQGLVVISVSVDDLEKPNTIAKVNKFLNEMESPFRNLLLDEPWDAWAGRLKVKGIPCYYVFDRRGKWVRFSDEIDYDAMEKTVVQMLNEK